MSSNTSFMCHSTKQLPLASEKALTLHMSNHKPIMSDSTIGHKMNVNT